MEAMEISQAAADDEQPNQPIQPDEQQNQSRLRRWCHQQHSKNYTFSLTVIIAIIIVVLFLFAILIVALVTTCKSFTDPNYESVASVAANKCQEMSELLQNNNTKHYQRNITDVERYNYRLPRSVVPAKYTLRMIPILEQPFTFSGDVRILVTITEETQNITMHAVDLNINADDVSVTLLSGPGGQMRSEQLEIIDQLRDKERDFFIIKLKESLQLNKTYEIFIKFNGTLNDNMQGFYRSTYEYYNVTKWLAATQFQPTDARRAFPCFDEPALKAKFIIKLARTRVMSTVSNMKILETIDGGDEHPTLYWDIYKESVPMSTYLVAFVVSELKTIVKDHNIIVTTRPNANLGSRFASDNAPKLLSFFEDFFQIKYPLEKLGLVAIPDFSAGAMENWGLITFRETSMLYDEGMSPVMNKQKIAIMLAHEISHQWFGNLVTPKWWSNLWLNEGFATYMEYLGVDGIAKQWKTMDLFIVVELQQVFIMDALTSSHKIHIDVVSPDEINEIFDRISYGKGASIIRMMDHFLTRPVFQNGLTKYLKDNSYSAVDENVLWRYFTEAAYKENVLDTSLSVEQIMSSWIMQNGFPVLTVIRNYTERSVQISQEKYTYDYGYEHKLQSQNYVNESEPLWYVPITYTKQMNADFSHTKPTHWLLAEKELSIYNLTARTTEWIMVNLQQTGYYRVNYDTKNWDMIIEQLHNKKTYKKIPISNRAQLIDDSFNLARSGHIDYSIAMNLTQYLMNEFDYVPWKSALSSLYFLDNLLMTEGDYHLFQDFELELIDPIYNHLEESEPDKNDVMTGYMRLDITTFACHLGHKDCVGRHREEFYTWMRQSDPDNFNPVNPNMRPVIYCIAIKYGDYTEWRFLWERFRFGTSATEQEIILTALGCTREYSLLKRLLEMAIDPSTGIRKQDVGRVFAGVADNVIGHPLMFDFISENYNELNSYLGTSMYSVNYIIKHCVRITTKQELTDFHRFAVRNKLTGIRTIQQAIENGKLNIAWMQKNYDNLVSWLEDTA